MLNVTNDLWLMGKNDLTQHYMGWLFFRDSDWYFPLGLMDNVRYPGLCSVVYTDSIPLFAVFFKLFRRILPDVFQYFGIWGLMCYALQGGISALLVRRVCSSAMIIVPGSLLFILSPWMFARLYTHSALAAHWIILLAVLVCLEEVSVFRREINGSCTEEEGTGAKSKGKFCRRKTAIDENAVSGGINKDAERKGLGNRIGTNSAILKRHTLTFSLLLALAAAIHIYFIPMLLVFLGCGTLWAMWAERRSPLKACLWFASAFVPVLAALGVLYLLGAFAGSMSYSLGGLGDASANLNFLFNSVGHSAFFPKLPNPGAVWPDESFGYLGIGIWILFAAAAVLTAVKRDIRDYVFADRPLVVCSVLMLIIFLLLATSPEVAIGDTVLFSWRMHPAVEWVLNVFRSLGRFVWPICYSMALFAVTVIAKAADTSFDHAGRAGSAGNSRQADQADQEGCPGQESRINYMYQPGYTGNCNHWHFAGYTAVLVLSIGVLLQILDFGDFIMSNAASVLEVKGYIELREDVWDEFEDQYEHIYMFEESSWQDISIYAAKHGKTMSNTYLARFDPEELINEWKNTILDLEAGITFEDTLYIFDCSWTPEFFEFTDAIYVYNVDGYNIGFPEKLSGIDGYMIKEKSQ